MGISYDYAIDVWSAACTLYEMFTGKILFPGRSNNQMLKHMMEVKGRFPNKMVRKGQFMSQHFDEDNNFISVEIDRLSNKVKTIIYLFFLYNENHFYIDKRKDCL